MRKSPPSRRSTANCAIWSISSVAAAFIQKEDYLLQGRLVDGPVRQRSSAGRANRLAPQQVETAINVVWKGTHVSTPIGGGVTISPREALSKSNLLKDKDGKVGEARKDTDLKNLAKGQWWWD